MTLCNSAATCTKKTLMSLVFIVIVSNANSVSAGDEWNSLLLGGKTHTKQNRIQIARGLLENIYEPMNAFIPNAKPSERAWVKNEQRDMEALLNSNQTAYFERRDKLMRSPEYCLMTLKDRLVKIVNPLKIIAKRSASLSLREEMALWTEVVYWITADTNEADNNFLCLENAQVLEAKKVPGLMLFPGGGHDYWYMQTTTASHILDRIATFNSEVQRMSERLPTVF